jgi:hypothetical protein
VLRRALSSALDLVMQIAFSLEILTPTTARFCLVSLLKLEGQRIVGVLGLLCSNTSPLPLDRVVLLLLRL